MLLPCCILLTPSPRAVHSCLALFIARRRGSAIPHIKTTFIYEIPSLSLFSATEQVTLGHTLQAAHITLQQPNSEKLRSLPRVRVCLHVLVQVLPWAEQTLSKRALGETERRKSRVSPGWLRQRLQHIAVFHACILSMRPSMPLVCPSVGGDGGTDGWTNAE